MTDDANDPNERAPQTGKRSDGKASGAGSMGASRLAVSPAFFEKMKSIGASMEQITAILRNWAHLKGEDLARRLAEFRDSRASAHAVVKFDEKKGFALLDGFFKALGRDVRSLQNRLSKDEQIRLGLT